MALQPVLAASVAVIREGRVLLATRTKPPHLGIWFLPGGRVELGESLAEAAAREVLEETGVRAHITRFLGHSEQIQRDDTGEVTAHYVIAAFVARHVAGEAQPGPEAGDVFWALPADVQGTGSRTLAMTPGLQALLRSTLATTSDGRFATP